MNIKNRIILISALLGIGLYIIQSTVYFFLFQEDLGYIEALITKVPIAEIYNRALLILGVVLFGFLISSILGDLHFENEVLKMRETKNENNDDGEFINNLSYQIRTPLNAIVGFTELLKDPNLSSQSKQTYINHIYSGGNYLLQLVNNLIDISKIERNKLTLELQDCNLNKFLDDIVATSEERKTDYNKPDIEIRLIKPLKEDKFYISTDKNRLKQVLQNLVENSLQHTDEGFVEISCKVKDLDLLEFCIKDTGRGYTEERLSTIFGRYNKLTDNHNQPFDPSALRLGISKSIVKVLGGSFWADSKPGLGASFYFTIPFIQIEEKKSVAEPSEKTSVRLKKGNYNWENKTILIAEDVESNFIYLKELLRPTGAELIWAENGRIAVEKVQEVPKIDIVLLDILMPEMDGYEASLRIKEMRPDLPIIAQTAFSLETGKRKKELENFNAYLIKPIWGPQLFETIAKNLSA